MPSRRSRPRLTDYEDFRRFLRDFYLHEKSRDPAFSYGTFSRKAGLSSSNHLKLVADCGRRLDRALASRYSKALGLGPSETRYFHLLVDLDQAPDSRAAQAVRGELMLWRTEHRVRKVPAEDLFGALLPEERWCAALLLGLANLKDCRTDPAWLRRRLRPGFDEGLIRRVLGKMVQGGILARRGGRLKRTGMLWSPGTSFEKDIDHLGFQLAQDPVVQWEGRDTSMAFLPLMPKEALEIRESLSRWFKEVLSRRSAPVGPGQQLYLVLGDLFPLTKG